MYPTGIADELRKQGHDVSAVTARPELRALPVGDVFTVAQLERRAVVTVNIGDFCCIADAADVARQAHYGLVLVDPSKYARGSQRTVGRLVTALAGLLKAHPRVEATSARYWL